MFNATAGLFGISALIGGGTTYLLFKVGKLRLHQVEGPSMRPTFNPSDSFLKDVILVKNISSKKEAESIPTSSIVCLKHPKLERGYLVKRLIAHQNEIVDNYKRKQCGDCTIQSIRIPTGHCWVESDAGPGYLDSTSYLGPIPYGKVVGHALYVIWPLQRFKPL